MIAQSIVIKGQVPAQKNKKKMARIGNRNILYTEKSVKDWQDDVAIQLRMRNQSYTGKKVTIDYMFFVKDNRRRDIDNMIASVNDALVKAGIIDDDSWQVLSLGMATAEIDRENPRVALLIRTDDRPTKL